MSDEYDWEVWDESKTTFRQHVIAGCFAGVSEHVVFFPIDTIRTNLQAVANNDRVDVHKYGSYHKHAFDKYHSLQYRKFLTVKQSVRRKGFWVLWRGMSMTITACIPAHALYFSIYESIKRKFGDASAIGGALASMAHDAVMTPLDVVKQRMQLGLYRRPIDAIRSILHFEGFRALYTSYFTTILMNVPNAAVLVVTNDWMKSILNPSGKQNFSAFLVSGLVAGSLSGFVTCPLDVIKTRIQTQTGGVDNALRRYTGFWQTLKLMVKEEGIRSLFMGVSTRMLQQAPSAALSWTVYETVKRMLTYSHVFIKQENVTRVKQ